MLDVVVVTHPSCGLAYEVARSDIVSLLLKHGNVDTDPAE